MKQLSWCVERRMPIWIKERTQSFHLVIFVRQGHLEYIPVAHIGR